MPLKLLDVLHELPNHFLEPRNPPLPHLILISNYTVIIQHFAVEFLNVAHDFLSTEEMDIGDITESDFDSESADPRYLLSNNYIVLVGKFRSSFG